MTFVMDIYDSFTRYNIPDTSRLNRTHWRNIKHDNTPHPHTLRMFIYDNSLEC